MTDLEVFKRHVGYRVKADQDTFTGNGSTLTVNLRFENVFGVEVYFGDERSTDDQRDDGDHDDSTKAATNVPTDTSTSTTWSTTSTGCSSGPRTRSLRCSLRLLPRHNL